MTFPTQVHVSTDRTGTVTPAALPTNGNLLLIAGAHRGGYPSVPAGWTSLGTAHATGASGDQLYIGVMSKIASAETGGWIIGVETIYLEIAGGTIDSTTIGAYQSTTPSVCGGAVTPGDVDALVLGFAAVGEFFGTDTTPNADVTELCDIRQPSPPDSPVLWAGYKEVASPAPTTIGGTVIGAVGHLGNIGITVSILGTPVAASPGVKVDTTGGLEDGTPLFDGTADLMDWTIIRGASAEITGGANPGSAVFHLRRKERDGRYNPRNASSPLYPSLSDGLRVHIAVNNDGTLTASGTVKGLFAGRVTDITTLPDAGPLDAVITEFNCEDPLAWYQRTPVHVADSRTRSHRELRLAILSAIGETRYSLANEIETMPLSAADGDAFSVLGQINAANGTRHFARPSDNSVDWYRYTTYNRQHKLSGASDASVNAGTMHATDTSGWRLGADTVINQQRASVDDIEFLDSARVVWSHDALPLIVSTTTVIWATYPDYTDGATIEYEITGTTPTVTLTSFGRTAKIEITTAGTTTFTLLRVRGFEVVRGDPQSFLAEDLTSQAPPRGVRAGSEITGEYVGVLAMARGIAQHIVWRYGNPQLRPTLTIHNWFPYQFELDLYDVIDVTSLNLGETAGLFEIVGLTHTGYIASSTVVHHTVEYVLQECRVQSDPGWFVLDTSELDSTDILAY